MNGAAEAILEELLAQAITQTQLLQRLARGFSGGGSGAGGGTGGGANPAAAVISSFNPLSLALKAVTGAFSIIGSVISGTINIFKSLVGVVFDTTQRLAEFGKQAVTAGVKLSDFYNMLSELPIVGRLYSLASVVQQVNEAVLDLYRSTSSVGATFGGSLDLARQSAAQTGLTLDEFGRVIKGNSESLRLYAGTVEGGVMALTRMNRTFMTTSDRSGRSILDLGLKFDESANYLSSYMGMLSATGDQRNRSDEQIIAGAREYVYQLDALARLTGQERAELDKKLQAQKEEEAFNSFLLTLNETQRENAMTIMQTVKATNPEGVRQAMAQLQGLSMPIDDFGKALVNTGQAAELNSDIYTNIMNSNLSTEQIREEMVKILYRQGVGMRQFGGQQAQMMTVLGTNINFGAVTLARGVKNIDQALAQVRQQQIDAANGTAEAAAMTELGMRGFGSRLLGGVEKILAPIMPYLNKFTSIIMKLAEKALPYIALAVDKVVKKFEEYAKILGEQGLGAMFKKMFLDAQDGLTTLWESVKTPVINAFTSIINYLKPYFGNLMDSILGAVSDWIYEKTGFGESPEERKLKDERRAILRQAEAAANKSGANIDKIRLETDAKLARVEQRILDLRLRGISAVRTENGKPIYDENVVRLKSRDLQDESVLAGTVYPPKRHSGTIGMTGNWWEKESGPVNIQAGETVLTQGQLAQIVDTAGSNKLAVQVERLNNLTAQMLVYLKETADNTARTHKAAAAMSGNAFVM